jgi:hypothetical protein
MWATMERRKCLPYLNLTMDRFKSGFCLVFDVVRFGLIQNSFMSFRLIWFNSYNG